MSITRDRIDFDARYTVDGCKGIAFYLRGWAMLGYDEDHEPVYDDEHVAAVMVGDDQTHIIHVDDLTLLDEDAYCHVCGQVGCFHDGRAA